jgi:hypothetical protein
VVGGGSPLRAVSEVTKSNYIDILSEKSNYIEILSLMVQIKVEGFPRKICVFLFSIFSSFVLRDCSLVIRFSTLLYSTRFTVHI